MRTARSSGRPGGVSTRYPPRPDQTPPGPDTPREQAPQPVNRMTDACENITLPQLRCGR